MRVDLFVCTPIVCKFVYFLCCTAAIQYSPIAFFVKDTYILPILLPFLSLQGSLFKQHL